MALVGSFNVLNDALAFKQFMNENGDESVWWCKRKHRICDTLESMFRDGCGVIGLQEASHEHELLHLLKERGIRVEMILDPNTHSKPQTPYSLYISRLANYMVENRIVDPSTTMCQFASNGLETGVSDRLKEPFLGKYKCILQDILNDNKELAAEITGIGYTFTNNEQECIPEVDPKELYVPLDNGLVFLYRTDIVKPLKPVSDVKVFGWTFETQGVAFTVLNAHLKSGESFKDELRRREEIEYLLTIAVKIPKVIILMDSNTSQYYEESFKSDMAFDSSLLVSSCISNYGFKNVLAGCSGFECFKMRDGLCSQVDKRAELMVDPIDKILVRDSTEGEPIHIQPEVFRTLTGEHRAIALDWRNSKEKRQIFKSFAVNRKWGLKMSENDTSGMDQVLQCDTGTVKAVLNNLYPNNHCCSDHPPVMAIVHILN